MTEQWLKMIKELNDPIIEEWKIETPPRKSAYDDWPLCQNQCWNNSQRFLSNSLTHVWQFYEILMNCDFLARTILL
jgi:hypothetical protein